MIIWVMRVEPPAPASRRPDPSPETPVFRDFSVGDDPPKPGDIRVYPRSARIYDPPEADNPLLDAWLSSNDPIAWIGLLGGDTIDG